MEDIEEDKIANKVLEGLPPSFMVFGTQKDLDPLEEFWMNKLTNIERQYDQHVVELERKLLSDRAKKRSIKKQATKITNLKEELQTQSSEIERWRSQAGNLSTQLKDKEYETKSLREKLERASTVTKNVSRRMEEERQARIQYEKECSNLQNRLRALEKEKAQLLLDVEIKESEKARVEERESGLHREKWGFIRNISELDTECRVQTNANLKLCEDMEKLLGIEKSLEVGLLRERQAISEMMEEMKTQRQKHQNALRQLDISHEQIRDAQESLAYSSHRNTDLERDVRHWKEESQIQEKDTAHQNQEIRDLKRRNSNIRCILADTKHKLTACLSEMKSLQNEKRRAEVELESAKRQEKALQLEIKKNELRKYKLAEKILKAHPLLMHRSGEDASRGTSTHTGNGARACAQKTELESYKKRIWKLERHKDDVERKLRELQRKENIYRIKLDKYAGMERQIFWMGKAMAKLEGDRNRLEQLLKTMESNMPMKVPFKKLVTDPSVLDRLAKNKVLQKRLFQQAEKIEELKSNARRILQFREEQFTAMDQLHEEIPSWKLSYWNMSTNKNMISPDNMLSGLNMDIMKRGSFPEVTIMKPFTDENYYKNYMHHLNEEIPRLKREIDHLERKKIYIEAENENEQMSQRKAVKADLERVKMSTLMLPEEEKPVDEPSEVSEQNGRGQCTPELSMHGSSFDETKKAGLAKNLDRESSAKPEEKVHQAAPAAAGSQRSSPTDDEGNVDDDAAEGDSSEAASEIPSDKL